ncbi:TPA: head completion/stabilization protein [Yersinia enterocolitica]|uniref:head completion/stabilization protein n=1 Tax=Yersinia enterocolitica TaxID=630 RepID=UPI0005E6C793|nr:head completion/stabilization protein [Yersinia enterocolitica]EKN3385681.1 head completion/stabilization protein [Yersinia enterocolitica]EKN3571403.1 head completion/stabilization protein [Yersinia enterocolitica]EKN3767646.1 head completion/stabilization protein [Yersinia enterocolitica]EKN4012092.1 head completion/stabilization protein [Yersinia enterocolitica]EKN4082118.1 head completion/stabilization protein [Yersinia enterocolitica]
MSLLATEPVHPTSPPEGPDVTITSAAFWPEISLNHMRKVMRLDGNVTTERLKEAVIEAISNTNGQLRAWRSEQEAAGVMTLEDVEAEEVAGESIRVQRYRRAVYCHAKANLTERYRDMDTTGDGNKRADALDPQITDLWRDARWAISDVQGRERGIAELV